MLIIPLLACKPQTQGVDNTEYDLYKESQFANGFALIKDDYGKRLNPKHDELNYVDGIMNASVMFGEMDLLSIKKQVIAKMDASDSEIQKDEEGIWRPLYDGVRHSHGHGYRMLDAVAYWLIFNPQVDRKLWDGNADYDIALADIAVVTAVSRMDIPYWHQKITSCTETELVTPEQQSDLQLLIENTQKCMKDYDKTIQNIVKKIYPKIKALPEYIAIKNKKDTD